MTIYEITEKDLMESLADIIKLDELSKSDTKRHKANIVYEIAEDYKDAIDGYVYSYLERNINDMIEKYFAEKG